jgi:hypothetical protein
MPHGGQKGNVNGFRHGAYSLLAMRTKGKPKGNTALGRAFRAREREYLQDMGGEENASLAKRQIANDSTWCDFMIATMDHQLESKRRLVVKGKPHPLMELRMRVAAHRRENYKLAGIERVAKPATWDDFKPQQKEPSASREDETSPPVRESEGEP